MTLALPSATARGGLLPLAVLLLAPLALAGGAPWLTVRTADGALLLALPLQDEPAWELRWRHSVTGIPVRDLYRWDGRRMLLTASHQPAFDAGLGHVPGRGRLESDGAGGYWIRDIDEPVPGARYPLRVGAARVDHRLVHGGSSRSLSGLAAGERVWIGVEAW